MSIFIELGNKCINIDKIREIEIAQNNIINITFDDSSVGAYNTYEDAENAVVELTRTIVQLVPCTSPLYNVYKNRTGGYFHEQVDYVALCADGMVRSLAKAEYSLTLAEEALHFVGCFDEDKLDDFPEDEEKNL